MRKHLTIFLILIVFIITALALIVRSVPPTNRVVLTNSLDVQHTLYVGVANDPMEREYGLMGLTYLPADQGMLFLFDVEQELSFWMKDTLIPLDIVFVDSNLKIVRIHANTKPNQTSEIYPSDVPVKYAIETNGGWMERAGIKVGDSIKIEISGEDSSN